jgi:hypothetical protein
VNMALHQLKWALVKLVQLLLWLKHSRWV